MLIVVWLVCSQSPLTIMYFSYTKHSLSSNLSSAYEISDCRIAVPNKAHAFECFDLCDAWCWSCTFAMCVANGPLLVLSNQVRKPHENSTVSPDWGPALNSIAKGFDSYSKPSHNLGQWQVQMWFISSFLAVSPRVSLKCYYWQCYYWSSCAHEWLCHGTAGSMTQQH